MDVMKPIASSNIPRGDEWVYEVKYDGFRCILTWDFDHIKLTSKNNKDLTRLFPEIVEGCEAIKEHVTDILPLKLDGELVILNTPYQANFSLIQKRGRLKNKEKIHSQANKRPAHLAVFDLIMKQGHFLKEKAYDTRKALLNQLFNTLLDKNSHLYLVKAWDNPDHLWQKLFVHQAEGLVCKRKSSIYLSGKSHRDWWKVKNWRTIYCFLTSYDTNNGYFTVQVFDNDQPINIGKCKHGLDEQSLRTLKNLFMTKGEKNGNHYTLPPAIVATIHTLDLYDEELREPEFSQLAPNISAETCTLERLNYDLAMLPTEVNYSNFNKIYWPERKISKGSYLLYMRALAPYMIPFIKQRALTVIRCPDGVQGEAFFQKNLPEYAPNFIDYFPINEDEKLILCNNLNSLIWFANHGAIEYHLPFQQIKQSNPIEIVFDLDPPSRDQFSLAIEAALLIKQMLDNLDLISFIKTSGGKGLQIHIPIPEDSMSYEDTALFTQSIAWTIEQNSPDKFTTERLKKKRLGRLYIDYVQHGKDKTIIAPYSPRKTNDATVATPLYWDEVTYDLRPEPFTLNHVKKRVQELGCPFNNYFQVAKKQKMKKLKTLINS